MFRRLIVIATLVIALGAFEGPTASADSSNETFGFLAGSGFLCGLAPTACPDVSQGRQRRHDPDRGIRRSYDEPEDRQR